MKRVILYERIGERRLKETGKFIDYYKVMVEQTDGPARLYFHSHDELNGERKAVVHGDVPKEIVHEIRRQVELGKGVGEIGGYTWRQEN